MGTKRIRTAGAERQSALEAATQLMGERAKYEQWLDDLEAKKDATPAKVFDRVRQDYLTRLQSVMEQLGQHTAVLQEHAENLAAKLRDLEEAEDANTEEQAEAALRKQVGEISAAEWESGSKKAQRELLKIQENQAVISEELSQIRDLLGEDEDEEEEGEEEGEKEAKKGSKDFNELEFLTKVVGDEPPAPPVAAPPRSSAPTAQRATPSAPNTRVAAPTPPRSTPSAPRAAQAPPATAAPSASPAAALPPAAAAPAPAPPAPAAAEKAAPPSTPAATPAPTPPATPASGAPTKGRQTEATNVLDDSEVADQPKTLRCTECSAMNYPSEWYCERCGAELTVV